jgi:hypothetical protein
MYVSYAHYVYYPFYCSLLALGVNFHLLSRSAQPRRLGFSVSWFRVIGFRALGHRLSRTQVASFFYKSRTHSRCLRRRTRARRHRQTHPNSKHKFTRSRAPAHRHASMSGMQQEVAEAPRPPSHQISSPPATSARQQNTSSHARARAHTDMLAGRRGGRRRNLVR